MQVLDPKLSLITYWQHLVYTEAALLAHPDAAPLAPAFDALLKEFEALLGADLATRRASIQAQAHAVIADKNLDDGLRELHSDALHEVRQDRAHAVFTALFESDIGATIRFALARQLEVADAIVAKLGLTIVPEGLRSHVGTLGALIGKGRTVLGGKKAAALARTEANLGAAAWKDDANAARLTAYGALLGIAAKTRRPKTWADAFFMRSADAPEGVDVGGAPAEGPAGGAGGTTPEG